MIRTAVAKLGCMLILLAGGMNELPAQTSGPAAASGAGELLCRLDRDIPAVVYFYAGDSASSRQFEESVNAHQGIAALAPVFRWYQIRLDHAEAAPLAAAWRVLEAPAVFVVTGDGSAPPTGTSIQPNADALFTAMARVAAARQDPAERAALPPPLRYGIGSNALDAEMIRTLVAREAERQKALPAKPAATSAAQAAPPAATEAPATAGTPIGRPVLAEDPSDQAAVAAGSDITAAEISRFGENLVFAFTMAGPAQPRVHIFINSDASMETGFAAANLPGADLLIEGATVFRHRGGAADWTWDTLGTAQIETAGSTLRIVAPLSLLGLQPGQGIGLAFGTFDETYQPIDRVPESSPIQWLIPQE